MVKLSPFQPLANRVPNRLVPRDVLFQAQSASGALGEGLLPSTQDLT